MVPRRLPVAERRHLVDVHLALDRVGQQLREAARLGGGLARRGGRVRERRPVAAAEQIRARPGPNAERAVREHRCERAPDQGLAGLPVVARVRDTDAAGEFVERGQPHRARRGEVDVAAPGAERGIGVEGVGGQYGVGSRQCRPQRGQVGEGGVRGRLRGGRGQVDHHDAVQPVPLAEVRQLPGYRGRLRCLGAGRHADAGPDLPVGRGQRLPYGDRQVRGQDACRDQLFRPFGQRDAGDVAAAEDQVADRGEARRAEVGQLGDAADRRGEPRRDGRGADDDRRGHGTACADDPHPQPGTVCGGRTHAFTSVRHLLRSVRGSVPSRPGKSVGRAAAGAVGRGRLIRAHGADVAVRQFSE
ncbi:hypothetical protein SCOCK_110109 [Actinacidiphila cocklensis]|uniref:Uncharacterized protein n=1 Tax=Actinacidiphila cocklensis TaxID=887465 RepID=A0A9W4DPQ9_9ACTN|nr:hypothetical protein SCOCK_110109 [Actinacidiphila cocklensis]